MIHLDLARLRLHNRATRVLAGALLAAPLLAQSGIGARADFQTSYPGGCTLLFTLTAPLGCSFTSMGGDAENVVFEGSGTVNIAGISPCTGSINVAPPGQTIQNGTLRGGCSYNVTFTTGSSGLVSVQDRDPAVSHWGQCAAQMLNPVMNSTISCQYTALTTLGNAVGEMPGLVSASLTTLSVQDNTAGTAAVSCAQGGGDPSATAECPTYVQVIGHQYTVTLFVNSGSGLDMAVVGTE